MQCTIDNLMWSVLKSENAKQKKLGFYVKIYRNFAWTDANALSSKKHAFELLDALQPVQHNYVTKIFMFACLLSALHTVSKTT